MRGYVRRVKIIRRVELKMSVGECIASTWSCTKSFWFLRPTDGLLSFKSRVTHGFEPWC